MELKEKDRHFVVEIKSTNNRFCDIKITMSVEFNEIEQKIIKLVKNIVRRGRIEIFILAEEEDKSDSDIFTNQELALTYYKVLKSLQQRLDLPDNIDLNMLLKFSESEIVKKKKIYTVSAEMEDTLYAAINEALKNFDDMRVEEGEAIYKDLIGRLKILKDEMQKIEEIYKTSFDENKNRLKQKIKELINNTSIDENRIVLEVALLSEKSDISEEIIRVKHHIKQFSDTCELNSIAGRKLDFIAQEINREVNTIGAKCNNLGISSHVIILKEELEKIREQIQNAE